MKIFFAFFLFCSSLVCRAAEIAFVVYHSKGIIVKSSSKIQLKKGDKIYLHEMLSLGNQASLILVCQNYQVIQLNKKGNYPVKDLLEQCKQKQSSYTSSYFEYVWNELTHPHGKPEKNPEAYMKNVGAVSRGCNTVSTTINVDTIFYGGGKLPLYWAASFRKPQGGVFEQAYDGSPLVKKALQLKQPIQMGEWTKDLPPGEYYWQITEDNGTGCERNYLKLWDSKAYQKEVARLLETVPVSTPGETAFLKGFLMEENHFLAEAIKFYGQAAKLDTKNKIYKNSLIKFYDQIP
jgi:hypothetical protein